MEKVTRWVNFLVVDGRLGAMVYTLIGFLQNGKYFQIFELIDEGGFWETDDEAVLARQWARHEKVLEMVSGLLRDFEVGGEKDAGALAGRLEAFLRRRLGDAR